MSGEKSIPERREGDGGNWIFTASGNQFFFNAEDIGAYGYPIEEIATALSRICRFGGHCDAFYSVADHSRMVADIIGHLQGDRACGYGGGPILMAGLLHDGPEAYIGDMVRPVKHLGEMGVYRALDQAIGGPLLAAHGTSGHFRFYGRPCGEIVKQADDIALAIERKTIAAISPHAWEKVSENALFGYDARDYAAPTPDESRRLFLEKYECLKKHIERDAAERPSPPRGGGAGSS